MKPGERETVRRARALLRGIPAAAPALELLRSLDPMPAARREDGPQLALWVQDADDLPPRPWRVHPDMPFNCKVLACRGMRASDCVKRQLETEAQRTEQKSRGQGSEHPHCDTRKCRQGQGIRAALAPDARVRWQGAGAGWLGRFERSRPPREQAQQDAARERLERVGLLEDVRTLDVDPDPSAVEE